jgi:hypothetical protein
MKEICNEGAKRVFSLRLLYYMSAFFKIKHIKISSSLAAEYIIHTSFFLPVQRI